MILAIVQKAGRNLNRCTLGVGSAAEEEEAGAALDFIPDERNALALGAGLESEETEAGICGVGADEGGFCIVALFPRGSLARIESSAFPEINFFILLCSFWSEAGVDIQAPQCWCDGCISQS